MSIVTTRVPDYLDQELSILAASTARTKSYILKTALKKYIHDMKEDIEDYKAALSVLNKDEAYSPIEDLIKKYELDKDIVLRNE